MLHGGASLDPIDHEDGLHLRDDRSRDFEVSVAPVLGILRVAGPLVADADPAGEADRAIDDEQLAMSAVVEPREVIPFRRVISFHLAACLFQLLEQCFVHFVGADPIKQDADFHSGSRAFGERIRKLRPISPDQ